MASPSSAPPHRSLELHVDATGTALVNLIIGEV